MVEFPGQLSFFFRALFGGTENIFKEYVRGVCMERGYSNDKSWDVYYSAREGATGNLKLHVDKIYEKFQQNLRDHDRTKRWSQTAADKICPDRSGGGGGARISALPGPYSRSMFSAMSYLPAEMSSVDSEMQSADANYEIGGGAYDPVDSAYSSRDILIAAAPFSFFRSAALAYAR